MVRISIVWPCLKELTPSIAGIVYRTFVYNSVLTNLPKIGFSQRSRRNQLGFQKFLRRQMRYRLSNTAAKFGVLMFPNGYENAGRV